MKIRFLAGLGPLVLLGILFAPAWAAAADHYNLEEGLPVELADTLPIHYRDLEFQAFSRWEHTAEG